MMLHKTYRSCHFHNIDSVPLILTLSSTTLAVCIIVTNPFIIADKAHLFKICRCSARLKGSIELWKRLSFEKNSASSLVKF